MLTRVEFHIIYRGLHVRASGTAMHNLVSSHSGCRARGKRQSKDGHDQDQMGNSIQGLKTVLNENKILVLVFVNFPVSWSINMY